MANLVLKAVVMMLTLAVVGSHAQAPDRDHLKALSEAELKIGYLECDQLAASTFLSMDSAANCSMVAEELLERSFGGSFQQLLDWWRSARNDCQRYVDCRAFQNRPSEPRRP